MNGAGDDHLEYRPSAQVSFLVGAADQTALTEVICPCVPMEPRVSQWGPCPSPAPGRHPNRKLNGGTQGPRDCQRALELSRGNPPPGSSHQTRPLSVAPAATVKYTPLGLLLSP